MSEQNQTDKTPGLLSWNELTSNDGPGSAKFYTQLFDWKREDVDMGTGTYTIFKVGERSVAGMFALPSEVKEMPSVWIPYVTVENLEASVNKAVTLGAVLCKEITSLQMGRFAIVRDPQGAILGLWQFA